MRLKNRWTATFAVAAALTMAGTMSASASTAQAETSTAIMRVRDLSDCPVHWVCIWEWPQYSGAGTRYIGAGTRNLGDYDWRDRVSSVYNRTDATVTLVDSRSFLESDKTLAVHAGSLIPDLGNVSYPGGGTWNNKVDKIELG
ncbi:peptidase inhibitor family I36 protein [Streptosporangium sp. NBC_01639]|uniref:peptidase inhibitor family I36 protein n=1 Tax=Streptosporangium sp. NBC_01639 TaxID=2975948 RepID=UPI003864C029|nr:peptidase inhibitor family I36 protein [Streptosporangium sp. NBC_01639]WTD55948.1 peptidase inhibitor family I36 protein [Streptosporangium sp. NBC_01639]